MRIFHSLEPDRLSSTVISTELVASFCHMTGIFPNSDNSALISAERSIFLSIKGSAEQQRCYNANFLRKSADYLNSRMPFFSQFFNFFRNISEYTNFDARVFFQQNLGREAENKNLAVQR